MPLGPSELNQLTVILTLAILLFIVAMASPPKVAATVLLLLVPYQAIETRFGSSSVVLAYVVFIALLLRKERVQLPMLPHFLFLILWCLVSMSLMHPSTYAQHGAYIFALISAFLVFWICFDLTNRFADPLSIVNVFIAMNILAAIYCGIQLWLGPGERLVLFGISEMSMTRVRADGRLSGPFESAEITGEYFALMQFVVLHQYWYTSKSWYKRVLVGLAVVNLALLVATGTRGPFLLLLGGAFVYLWLFRKRLGIKRAVGFIVGGAIIFATTTFVVVNTTQFGGLLDRLASTEFNEQGIPDTRQKFWPVAVEEIAKSPIIGHGPRFRFHLEERGVRYEHHVFIRYPHNLYLFLLFTIGIPGLVLFMFVVGTFFSRCWRAMSRSNGPPFFSDLARTGVIVIMLFVIDGIKIDQMRLDFSDYWHFFFGLCGMFMAACAKVKDKPPLEAAKNAPLPDSSIASTEIGARRRVFVR